MHLLRVLAVLLLTSIGSTSTFAQVQPGMEFSGLDSRAYAALTYDDGTGPALYATGIVNNGDGIFLNNIGKWDGSRWQPLRFGLGNPATTDLWEGWALAVHDDGGGDKLCVGGRFFQASGVPALNIACWDGTNWSALGDGLDDRVFYLASYDDGGGATLYAAGSFTGGMSAWDGSAWQEVPGASSVGTMQVFDDGNGAKLYAAGTFDAGGMNTSGIGAWDGTSWQALQSAGGEGVSGGSINAMAVYDDGTGDKLYVGGAFQTAGGLPSPFLAAWTGTTWVALPDLPIQEGVDALTVYDDGSGPRLVAAFNVKNEPNVVAAWDGEGWNELDVPGRLAPLSVNDLTVLDGPEGAGQRLIAAGSFLQSGNVNKAYHVAQWDGQSWTNVGADLLGLDRPAASFAVYDDGDGDNLYLGGGFDVAGNAFAEAVARFDGTEFSGLRDPSGEGLLNSDTPTFDDDVFKLEVFDDGLGGGAKLYAGGSFIRPGDNPLQHLAVWDGTSWQAVGTPDEYVGALEVFDDGGGDDLYVGGRFDTIDGLTLNRIARWDGVSFTALDDGGSVGLPGTVINMAVFDDGFGPALYVVGSFFEAGGAPVDGLARWDAKDGWMNVGGFDIEGNEIPFDLAVYDDGGGPALYISGNFLQVNGQTVNGIVKWDGSTFSPLTDFGGTGLLDEGGSPDVIDMVAYDAGAGERLYVVGNFDTAGGRSAHNVASWDGSRWRPLIGDAPLIYEVHNGAGVPNASQIFGHDDGGVPTLFISGRFSEIAGVKSYFIARYRDLESVFIDGFESGDVSAWSTAAGLP